MMMPADSGSGETGSDRPKRRRVPKPRVAPGKGSAPGNKRRVPVPPRKGASQPPVPGDGAPVEGAQQDAAQRQEALRRAAVEKAAAEKAAAQKLAAQQMAAQKAAAEKAAAQKAAAQKLAAQKLAAQKIAAQKAAAEKLAAQKAAAEQAALRQAAAEKAAQLEREAQEKLAEARRMQAAAGEEAATGPVAPPAPIAPQGSPPKAPPQAPRPAAPRRGKAPPRAPGKAPRRGVRKGMAKRPAAARQKAARPVDSDGDDRFSTAEPGKKKNTGLIIGGVSIVAIVVVLLVLSLGGDPPKPEPSPVASVPDKPKVDPKKEQEEKASEVLQRVRTANAEEPQNFSDAVNRLLSVNQGYPTTAAGRQALQERQAMMDRWRSEAEASWAGLKVEVQQKFSSGEFIEAASLLENLPAVFNDADHYLSTSFGVEFTNLKRDAVVQKEAKRHLDELTNKAAGYATDGWDDIARAILDFFPDRYEEDAPDVWQMRTDTMARIEREGLAMVLEKEKIAEDEIAEVRRIEEEAKERERERRWQELRESVAWKPHLGRHNLYNWVASSDRILLVQGQETSWRISKREEVPVLIGDNKSGSEIYTGVFTNHWQDYVLEFEMNRKSGSLQVSPRTQFQVGRFQIGDETSPALELGEDVPRNTWVKVTIEVTGRRVSMQVGDDAEPTVLDEETTRLPASGGFLFKIPDESRIELRGIRSKVITTTRTGYF